MITDRSFRTHLDPEKTNRFRVLLKLRIVYICSYNRMTMHKILGFFIFFSLATQQLMSQVIPGERKMLNYRLIGFSFPPVSGADSYRLEIAAGSCSNEKEFEKNIFKHLKTNTNRLIAEVPSFGKQYTWRVSAVKGTSVNTKSPLHHFSTGIIPEADTAVTRMRILKNAATYKDAYVFVDGTRALYDMRGNPVWYLPDIDSLSTADCYPRDMKLTPQGTITILIHKGIYELNYDAEILWKMPKNAHRSPDSVEFYHHEFTRLANGHYMTLGDEKLLCQKPASTDSNFALLPMEKALPNGTYSNDRMSFGTIIEYDENNRQVWAWKSSDYFKKSDIYFHKIASGFVDVHENAFYFDEKNKAAYLSFKGIDRIVKVNYPEGNVINAYGEKYKPGMGEPGNKLFCGQHSCRRSSDGYLYLFNNNFCNPASWPTLVMMKENPNTGKLEKIWEYECDVNYVGIRSPKPYSFGIGGNVFELPDKSFLASLSGSCTNIFIVNRDKKLLWSAVCERWSPETKQWNPILNYRASMITSRADMDRLIWNSVKK